MRFELKLGFVLLPVLILANGCGFLLPGLQRPVGRSFQDRAQPE